MDDHEEIWQRRIRDLYANVEELYSHIDITVMVFDRNGVDASANDDGAENPLGEPLAAIARQILDTGKPQHDVPLDPIGRKRAHGYPLRDGDTIVGVVCVVDDDGARRELFVRCAMAIFDGYRQKEAELLERERKALDEARRANRLRDQFLAMISHELRTPMSAILLWEQVLRHDQLDADTRVRALDAIHDSATGQALLVADLLDVSRAINGKLHIDRRATPIARVLETAIENARPSATLRQLELVSQLEPDLGAVLGDSRRLRQVLDNLLSNAIKATRQGRVSLRAWQGDDSITIEVRDTGRGIARTSLPHLFEPFWQADESAPDGLGLGLTIARQLVELHGGTLSASSEGIGCGTTFTVRLPRIVARVHDEALALPAIVGVRVLMVDDDAQSLEPLEILLRGVGAVVASEHSASAAYAVLQRDDTDVVLSDIAMPGEDGYTFVRRVRQTPGAMRSLPAIAITARASEHDRQRALDAGFDRFLTKPLDVALLISTIAQLVE